MRIKKRRGLFRRKPKLNHSTKLEPNLLFNERDYLSAHSSKLKTVLKVALTVTILVISGHYINNWLFDGGNNISTSKNDYGGYYNQSTSERDDKKLKLSQCLSDVSEQNPTPETSDPNFSDKLIGNYNKMLACYDKYPNVDSIGRSGVESAKQSAISTLYNSQRKYSSSYSYGSSTDYKSPATGCSYKLSEQDFIKCTNDYFAKIGQSTNASQVQAQNQSAATNDRPPTVNTQPSQEQAVNVAWCNAKKPELDKLYADYATAQNSVRDKQYELNNVALTVGQKFGGTGATVDRIQRAIEARRAAIEQELSTLKFQESVAKQSYDEMKREYDRQGCK